MILQPGSGSCHLRDPAGWPDAAWPRRSRDQRSVLCPGRTASRQGPPLRCHPLPCHGFTLIELVFVMVIVSILLASTAPRFHHTQNRLQTEQFAFQLAQLLRYAHERAVTEMQEVVWVWDEKERRLQLEVVRADQTSGQLVSETLEDRFTIQEPLPDDLEILPTRHDVPVDRIRFFPDGTSERTSIKIQRDHAEYVVNVDPATSDAKVSARTAAR